MDASDNYRRLIALGREEFLAAAAPAALVRGGSRTVDRAWLDRALLEEETLGETMAPPLRIAEGDRERALEVYPLVKKPGASFPDRITIGRTPNNDIVLPDPSVSRLHAYVRRQADGWVVADAGSKNGSWLGGAVLEPRRERPLATGSALRLGEIDLTFYEAADLFDALGGS